MTEKLLSTADVGKILGITLSVRAVMDTGVKPVIIQHNRKPSWNGCGGAPAFWSKSDLTEIVNGIYRNMNTNVKKYNESATDNP